MNQGTMNQAQDAIEADFPAEFWQGVEQFNAGEFYACHDTLEAVWIEAAEADKKFYQGILQIAVALYHLGNQNLRGAVILLGEGSNRLRAYSVGYVQIDISDFIQQAIELLTDLQTHDPQQPLPLPPQSFKIRRLQTDLDLC